ncbi:MAG: hypothetical protein JWQ73_1335, partial [Variovorax sp.]|nr:hypothetical protein [Variovorax sp.]
LGFEVRTRLRLTSMRKVANPALKADGSVAES